jgi:hypothetical protein
MGGERQGMAYSKIIVHLETGFMAANRLRVSLLLLSLLASVSAAQTPPRPAAPSLSVDSEVRLGERPDVRLSGLTPRVTARLHYLVQFGDPMAPAAGRCAKR